MYDNNDDIYKETEINSPRQNQRNKIRRSILKRNSVKSSVSINFQYNQEKKEKVIKLKIQKVKEKKDLSNFTVRGFNTREFILIILIKE